jgi:hypothetical protein
VFPLTRFVQVLGLGHELQGPKFSGFVDNPSYRLLLSRKIKEFDMAFEEASGRIPSIAGETADSLLGSGHYVDVDPGANDREKFGIPTETVKSECIDPWDSKDSFLHLIADAQAKREEHWVRRISEQEFSKALMICGIGHSLSITFRLVAAGFIVKDPWAYLPHYKLCSRSFIDEVNLSNLAKRVKLKRNAQKRELYVGDTLVRSFSSEEEEQCVALVKEIQYRLLK